MASTTNCARKYQACLSKLPKVPKKPNCAKLTSPADIERCNRQMTAYLDALDTYQQAWFKCLIGFITCAVRDYGALSRTPGRRARAR